MNNFRTLMQISATMLLLSQPSTLSAEETATQIGAYADALRALQSLPGYSGSRFSQWEGGTVSLVGRDRRDSEFCVRPSEGRAHYSSTSEDYLGETVVVGNRTYSKTRGSTKWSVHTSEDPVEYAPWLRKVFTDARPPDDLGITMVLDEPMRHLRGRYDVEAIIDRKRAENRAAGGSLATGTEAELKTAYGRSRFDLWIDANGVPRRIRVFEYSGAELGGYQVSESTLSPGCDRAIVEPSPEEQHAEYRRPTGLALVHRVGDVRREFHGGECYWVGQRGSGVTMISYTATDYTLSIDVQSSGDQWNFYESLAERPDLASASAGWRLGDDSYRLEVPEGEVDISSDLRSISFSGTITDHGQSGSRKRFALDRPTPVSFDVTCLNEPDSTMKENWDKKKESKRELPRVITIQPPERRSGAGAYR